MGTANFYDLTKGRNGREINNIKKVCAKVVKTYAKNVDSKLSMSFDKSLIFNEALDKYRELFKSCVDYYILNIGYETSEMRMAFETLPKYFKKSNFIMINKDIIAKSLMSLFELVIKGVMESERGSK